MAPVSELKGLVLCHANSPAFFQPATGMEASFQWRWPLRAKRNPDCSGVPRDDHTLKIRDLLKRIATVTTSLLIHMCVCVGEPLDVNNMKQITSYSNIFAFFPPSPSLLFFFSFTQPKYLFSLWLFLGCRGRNFVEKNKLDICILLICQIFSQYLTSSLINTCM